MTSPPHVALNQVKLNVPKSEFSFDKQGVSSRTRKSSRVARQIASQQTTSQRLSRLVSAEVGGSICNWHVKRWQNQEAEPLLKAVETI